MAGPTRRERVPARQPPARGPAVVAVVVAYNRRELLLESLAAIRGQTVPPVAVVVVDNASDDGSADAARSAWPDLDVVPLDRNTGGPARRPAGHADPRARPEPDGPRRLD